MDQRPGKIYFCPLTSSLTGNAEIQRWTDCASGCGAGGAHLGPDELIVGYGALAEAS